MKNELYPQIIALFTQGTDNSRGIAVELPKLTGEIACGVESAGLADFLDGKCRIAKEQVRLLQSVLNQEIDGCFL